MTHNLDKSELAYMERNKPGKDWSPEEKKAALSYLALPCRTVKRSTVCDEDAMFAGEMAWDLGISATVDKQSLTLNESQRKRFDRAMRILGLDVYLHPSQLKHEVSALSAKHGYASGALPEVVTHQIPHKQMIKHRSTKENLKCEFPPV